MRMARTRSRRKAPTNVSVRVRVDLLHRAKELELNHSELLGEDDRRTWLANSEEAISRYNTRVSTDGVFSDDWRRF